MNRRNIVIAALIAVFFGGCGAFYAAGSFVTEEVEVGFQGEARRNRFLAAERLLEELGVPADGAARLGELPPADHVLFLRAFGHGLGAGTAEDLRAWMEAGGRLVLLLPELELSLFEMLADERIDPETPESRFLQELGIEVVLDDEDADEDAEEEAEEEAEHVHAVGETEDGLVEGESEQGLVELRVGGDVHAVDLGSPYRIRLHGLDPVVALGPEDRHTLIRVRFGSGDLVAVGSGSWMANEHLDEHDHAALLWRLTRLAGPPAGALLVSGERMPNLLSALWLYAPLLCAAGLAWIALWLWSRAGRFGPTLPDPTRDRRDFADHVVAAGAFLWRHRASSELLGPARRAAAEPWLHRLSGASGDEEAPVGVIAEATGLTEARVRDALSGPARDDPNHFTRVVRDLARIRRT